MNISAPTLPPSTLSAQAISTALFARDLSDEVVLRGIAQQEMDAMEVLYDRYAGALYGFISRIVRDGSAAEGLVQETFFTVWQKASEFNGTGEPGAWMFRIARNRALDHLRRVKVRPVPAHPEVEAYYDLKASASNVAPTPPEGVVEQSYDRAHLRTALAALPFEQPRTRKF